MKKVRRKHLGVASLAAFVGVLALLAAGCGGDDGDSSATDAWQLPGLGSTLEEIQANAKNEGEVNIVQWPTYATLVEEFATETGCTVNTKDAGTGDEMITLIQSGEYDGVSASGHTSVRLMEAGDVAPGQPGPDCRTTPTSRRASSSSPTTRRMASPTAARTDVGRTT